MPNPVSGNPLLTRSDLERGALDLLQAVIPLLSPGKARIHLGTAAVYPADVVMEAFIRPRGHHPLLAGQCKAVRSSGRTGGRASSTVWIPLTRSTGGAWATRPAHGGDKALAMGMILAPERFVSEPTAGQENLHAWLRRSTGGRCPGTTGYSSASWSTRRSCSTGWPMMQSGWRKISRTSRPTTKGTDGTTIIRTSGITTPSGPSTSMG